MQGLDRRRRMLGMTLAAAVLGVTACGGAEAERSQDSASARTGAHRHSATDAPEVATGLRSWAHGHRLVAERTRFEPRQQATLAFRIVDRAGRPVRRFAVEQTKPMHVIVVRRDLSGYQHLHPKMTASGRWSVPLTLRTPGAFRAFADFVVDGRRTVLGVDLHAPGQSRPASLRTVKRVASAGAYRVRLAWPKDGLRARAEQLLTFTVSRAGNPVVSLQPYLGTIGHLVVLRERDLSYLHVHPRHEHGGDGHTRAGPTIQFATQLPSASRYRAFLQFRAGGKVRTVAFTIAARA